jgi:hypothetical protein
VPALVLKLTLAPGLVAVATLVARRLGNRAGGLVAGLPVVAGPIVLIYAVEHGDRYARLASAAAVLGMLSQVGFCVAYALLARRSSVLAAELGSSLTFAVGVLCLSGIDPPLAISTPVAFAAIWGATRLIGRLAPATPPPRPQGDLLGWRLLITAGLVLGLTAAAGGLSPHLAGLLVPLPIITGVMAGFTQARAGGPAAVELLGGLTLALFSFLAFFVVLAALLTTVSAVAAFALATAASLASWAALAWFVSDRPVRPSTGRRRTRDARA